MNNCRARKARRALPLVVALSRAACCGEGRDDQRLVARCLLLPWPHPLPLRKWSRGRSPPVRPKRCASWSLGPREPSLWRGTPERCWRGAGQGWGGRGRGRARGLWRGGADGTGWQWWGGAWCHCLGGKVGRGQWGNGWVCSCMEYAAVAASPQSSARSFTCPGRAFERTPRYVASSSSLQTLVCSSASLEALVCVSSRKPPALSAAAACGTRPRGNPMTDAAPDAMRPVCGGAGPVEAVAYCPQVGSRCACCAWQPCHALPPCMSCSVPSYHARAAALPPSILPHPTRARERARGRAGEESKRAAASGSQ